MNSVEMKNSKGIQCLALVDTERFQAGRVEEGVKSQPAPTINRGHRCLHDRPAVRVGLGTERRFERPDRAGSPVPAKIFRGTHPEGRVRIPEKLVDNQGARLAQLVLVDQRAEGAGLFVWTAALEHLVRHLAKAVAVVVAGQEGVEVRPAVAIVKRFGEAFGIGLFGEKISDTSTSDPDQSVQPLQLVTKTGGAPKPRPLKIYSFILSSCN